MLYVNQQHTEQEDVIRTTLYEPSRGKSRYQVLVGIERMHSYTRTSCGQLGEAHSIHTNAEIMHTR